MQPDNFSAQASLQLIDQMIKQAKNRISENGFLYLLWGWLILFCSLGHFVLLQAGWFTHPEVIWSVCWLAVIFQVIYLSKKKGKRTVKTYSENIIGFVWVSFGICIFILMFILAKRQAWNNMYPLLLMLYGLPTFLSGVVMQFRPLRLGGISCWILSVISLFLLPIYGLLLLAAAMITAWIIPGYLLRKIYNQHSNTSRNS
jgi:hypothetical protein